MKFVVLYIAGAGDYLFISTVISLQSYFYQCWVLTILYLSLALIRDEIGSSFSSERRSSREER